MASSAGISCDLCIISFHQEGILNMRYYFRELSDIRISLPFHLSQFNSPFPTSYTFPMFKLCYPSTESWFKMLHKKKYEDMYRQNVLISLMCIPET